MLTLMIVPPELFDDIKQEFIDQKPHPIQLEHSLVSISKWESKWCKPFLSKEDKTLEQTLDYIRCMTITQNVDPDIYEYITNEDIRLVNEYIDLPMTATSFRKNGNAPNREIITAELIYYWMITYNINFECQKWHLNRLLTLINVCNIKNQPPKKRSQAEVMAENAKLNEERRKAMNTTG